MLSTPDGLTDGHRTVFYRSVAVDTPTRYRSATDRIAAVRSTSRGSSPNSAL